MISFRVLHNWCIKLQVVWIGEVYQRHWIIYFTRLQILDNKTRFCRGTGNYNQQVNVAVEINYEIWNLLMFIYPSLHECTELPSTSTHCARCRAGVQSTYCGFLCSCIYIITWLLFKSLRIMQPATPPPPRRTDIHGIPRNLLPTWDQVPDCSIIEWNLRHAACLTEPQIKQRQSLSCVGWKWVGGLRDTNNSQTHIYQPRTHTHTVLWMVCG